MTDQLIPADSVQQIDSIKHDVLQHFLTVDIQDQLEWAEVIIKVIRDLEKGKQTHWAMPMNFYELILTPDTARIESAYTEISESKISMPLALFKEALLDWLSSDIT